jgi:hypothetical protein
MLERIQVPFGAGRLQRDILVAPLKKESIQSEVLSKYGKTAGIPVTGLLKPPARYTPVRYTPAGYKIKNVIAELEKRRAALSARAQRAAAQARAADQKRAEAEAVARAAMEKAHKFESLLLGAEADTREDAERQLVFGFLVFSNGKTEIGDSETTKSLGADKANQARRPRGFFELKMLGEDLKTKLKFMGYGLVIALLLLGVSWSLIGTFS